MGQEEERLREVAGGPDRVGLCVQNQGPWLLL